ncbi:hypothetical protein Y032_0010g917 [Ancylostoma ceylanicum]|uniref:Uncharacterized protein n=1 Tax=Ancylostoma ceylanicum TaxID=53326 RepID=A0A016VHD2_9BILA|nr:hypothetical protein Y032_0010g917 [Ancylostoma ceylanicum]
MQIVAGSLPGLPERDHGGRRVVNPEHCIAATALNVGSPTEWNQREGRIAKWLSHLSTFRLFLVISLTSQPALDVIVQLC